MSKDRSTLIASGAIAVIVLGAGTAYATSGTLQLGSNAASVSSAAGTTRAADSARVPVRRIGTATSGGFVDDNGTPDTSDDVIASVATCPLRSQATGGGGRDFTVDGVLYFSVPIGARQWVVLSTADPTTADPADVRAYARCYNPNANVANVNARTTARQIPESVREMARKAAAKR